MNYENDEIGTKTNYCALNEAVSNFRACDAECADIPDDWKRDIERDYLKRHKK